jgi:hypothetical protein
MQEGDQVMSHISSMEVKYDDEDLGLLLLCSLPNSYANFCDTILLSRDELSLAEVYEALQSRKKMKGMVQSDGSSSSKGEALHVRGIFELRSSNDSNNRDKSYDGRGRSKSKHLRSSVSTARRKLTLLRIVGNFRIRRIGKTILMVRLLLFRLLKTLIREIVWLYLLVVFLVMMNGYLILHVHFISALTEIGLVPINLCRKEMLCI